MRGFILISSIATLILCAWAIGTIVYTAYKDRQEKKERKNEY